MVLKRSAKFGSLRVVTSFIAPFTNFSSVSSFTSSVALTSLSPELTITRASKSSHNSHVKRYLTWKSEIVTVSHPTAPSPPSRLCLDVGFVEGFSQVKENVSEKIFNSYPIFFIFPFLFFSHGKYFHKFKIHTTKRMHVQREKLDSVIAKGKT